jgi:DNA (cytosine-5)-methyltransferase 1
MFTEETSSAHAVSVTPIQDAREIDKKQNGLGVGEEGAPAYTVDTISHQSVNVGTSVRRLTPTECERLQGFPDEWTADQSDSARYKQMGNAVVNWIGKRL